MSDWTDGYVNEISYTTGYYPEMSPWMIYYAILAQGYRPPKVDQPFNFCELGSGLGFSANLHAAGNPLASFYCTDFNPVHTVASKELASEAGIENIQFLDKSFADFAELELPEFDIIALHGIFSWVSKQNREIILEIIRKQLRPGGAVYISYNAQPGCSTMQPLRALMNQLAATTSEPLDVRIGRALAYVDKLIESKAGFFTNNPALAQHFSEIKEKSKNYLAHEYFNETWSPFSFRDLSAILAEAKLSFIGSCALLDNFDYHAPELIQSASDPSLKETLRDFLRNTTFRKDIFVRGPVRLNDNEQRELLDQVRFTLIADREGISLDVEKSMYTYNLKAEIYIPILDALNEDSKSMKELAETNTLAHVNHAQLHQAMQMLVGVGYVLPGPPTPNPETNERCNRFNRAVADSARKRDGNCPALISPQAATGISLDRVTQLAIDATRREGAPAESVVDVLWSDGMRFSRDGQELASREENITQVKELLAGHFQKKRFPTLSRCGIEIGPNRG